MICAVCRERLLFDGPMGYVHQDRSMYGEDGHAVVPVAGRCVNYGDGCPHGGVEGRTLSCRCGGPIGRE